MGVENILIIVTVHDLGMMGRLGNDFYRIVLSRARELIQLLHAKLLAIDSVIEPTETIEYSKSDPLSKS